MVKRLIALGLACGGLGAVRAFAPLSSCLARSPESSLKDEVWRGRRKPFSLFSIASCRNERPIGWKSPAPGGGLHWRSGGAGNGGVRDGGNGGGGGASGWSKEGNGDDGDGEGSVTLPQDVSELLAKAGRKFTELPTSTQKALMAGSMTSALLKRYLEVERRGGMVAQLLSISIFRDRLLMDVYLMDKIGIEMAVGAVAQSLAEWDRRREKLFNELDFAFADLLTCLVSNFAAVLIAAPSAAGAAASNAARNIPANMFQMVPPGTRPYALSDRLVCPFLKMPTLFVVGLAASLLGFGTTSILTLLRKQLHSKPAQPSPIAPLIASATGAAEETAQEDVVQKIPVLKTSLAVGVFLAVSTNVRYQLVSGVFEERGIARYLAHNKLADHLASFGVRACNTFVGSGQMIDYLKFLKLQE